MILCCCCCPTNLPISNVGRGVILGSTHTGGLVKVLVGSGVVTGDGAGAAADSMAIVGAGPGVPAPPAPPDWAH